MPPVDIKFEEFCKTAIESARKGFEIGQTSVAKYMARRRSPPSRRGMVDRCIVAANRRCLFVRK